MWVPSSLVHIPPLPSTLFPVVKRNRPAVHVLYSEFPAKFSVSGTISMTSTCNSHTSVQRTQAPTPVLHTAKRGGIWEQGTRLCTVSLAKVRTVECKIQCTLSISAVYMYLTCDTQEFFPHTYIHAQTPS